jgi:predicted ArsR family transcriptional regulator
VRRHLEILKSRGLVAELGSKEAEGRGRPEFSYALTSAALPNNLPGLASALLANATERDLRKLGRQLVSEAPRPAGNSTQRLVGAVRQLTPLGYKPRWEARPSRPEVVLGHCPYAAIIGKHPELCQMDAAILEDLLGADAEQLSKLQPGPQGTPQCVFRISTQKAS